MGQNNVLTKTSVFHSFKQSQYKNLLRYALNERIMQNVHVKKYSETASNTTTVSN